MIVLLMMMQIRDLNTSQFYFCVDSYESEIILKKLTAVHHVDRT